jgi:protoheme IX farnesyltransferase
MVRGDVTSRFQGWFHASHPFPILMVLMLTGLIGYTSAAGRPDPARLGGVLLAMLFSQLCIGWSNDYLDREHDRLFQPFKPVPSGMVDARALAIAAIAAGLAAAVAGAALGLVPLALLVAGTVAGVAYNLGVKDTPLSWVPYVAGFAVLPPFVWTALDTWSSAFVWLYPIGISLVLAAHLANVLPDVDTDTAAGSSGLGVVLGRGGTLVVLGLALAAPLPLVALSTTQIEYQASRVEAAIGVYAALLVVAAACYRLRPFRDGAILGFRVVVAASVFFAGAWLASL